MSKGKYRGQINDVDLRLFRIFISVAESGGFGAAEIDLNINRSTISTHMSDLEARLGMRLCSRSRGKSEFSLTTQGEQVYQVIKKLLAQLEDYRYQINTIQSQMTGRLRIALPDDWLEMSEACFKLAPVISRFRDVAPKVDLQIVTQAPNEVDVEILNGKADLGINTVHIKRPGLEYTTIFEHRSFLYCSKAHPLFDKADENISQEELLQYDLVTSSYKVQPSTYNLVSLFNRRATADHMEGCLLLMLSGNYLGFLPDYYAAARSEKYPLRQLKPNTFNYSAENAIIFKKDAKKNAIVNRFIKELMPALLV